MNGSKVAGEPGSEILALRQETLLLVRQQLVSPDASGTAEHIMAIQCLAGASFVSERPAVLLKRLDTHRQCELGTLISRQAYGFEPDVNFTIHMNALSSLLKVRGKSKYKKTGIGRIVLNVLVMSVTPKTRE
jgi:hypothetical protein